MFYFTRNFERQKLRLRKAKKFAILMSIPTSMPMLMPRYRCRDFQMADINICDAKSLALFKFNLLKLIRPISNPINNIYKPKGTQLLTRLRLGLSHLRYHKFTYIVLVTIKPLCTLIELHL